jgi:undecaprenyl-diphosphatase
MLENVLALDRQIFIWVHNLQQPWLNYFLAWPTYLGATWILLILIFLLMFLWDRKNILRKYSFMLLAMLSTDLVVHLLKHYLHRPRPFVGLKDITPVSVLFSEPISYSFPSGHAAIIFCAAVLINMLYHHRFVFLYGIALLVCVTRMYVGVHYPTDLIAGAALGAGMAYAAVLILKKVSPSTFHKVEEKPKPR